MSTRHRNYKGGRLLKGRAADAGVRTEGNPNSRDEDHGGTGSGGQKREGDPGAELEAPGKQGEGNVKTPAAAAGRMGSKEDGGSVRELRQPRTANALKCERSGGQGGERKPNQSRREEGRRTRPLRVQGREAELRKGKLKRRRESGKKRESLDT